MLPTGLVKLALWNSVQDVQLQVDDFNRLTQLRKLDYVDLDDFLPAVHVLPRLCTSVRKMKISSCKCNSADLKKLPTSVTSLTLFSCELVSEVPNHIKELFTARSGIPIGTQSLPQLRTLKWSGRHDYMSIAQLPTTINKLSLICTFPIPLHLEQCRFPPGLTSLSLSSFALTDLDLR